MGKKFCTGAEGFNHETQSCCERHDEAYASTSYMSRRDADLHLMICVARRGMPYRAMLLYIAVRMFGWLFYKGKG